VVAKGQGLVADQIIARAKEAGVFVHESKELVALLMEVDLDRQIPPVLYRAIAELLAWLYYIESAHAAGEAPPPPDTTRLLPQAPVGTDASNH
jgi:flagellar biosynthesis protein